jgi:hypothetical protein
MTFSTRAGILYQQMLQEKGGSTDGWNIYIWTDLVYPAGYPNVNPPTANLPFNLQTLTFTPGHWTSFRSALGQEVGTFLPPSFSGDHYSVRLRDLNR